MINVIRTLREKHSIERLLDYVQPYDVLDLGDFKLTIFKDDSTEQKTALILDDRYPEDILSDLFGGARVDLESFWELRDILFGMTHSKKFKKQIKQLARLSNQKHEKWRKRRLNE